MKEYPCDRLMYCPYGVDGYSTSCSEQCLLGRDEDEKDKSGGMDNE